jgi:enoyl-CoA hydratase/carnithine racemase
MIMGKALSADEALAVGLVHRVYEPEALRAESLKFAGELAERASLAIAAIKKCVRVGLDLPIQDGLKLELKEFLEVLRTGDAREGLDAFVNKRKPQFKGK